MSKIAALISIPLAEITMTTDFQIEYAYDAFKPNNVYNLAEISGVVSIAAVSWLQARRGQYDSLASGLQTVINASGKRLPQYSMWLLKGDSAWQIDSRVIRYKKLWKGLDQRGLPLESKSDLLEEIVEIPGKVRFFGAAKVDGQNFHSASKILYEEQLAYVALIVMTMWVEGKRVVR